jgi:hypothetical protein
MPRSRVLRVNWVPIAAWGAAVFVALVVLGFCAYEIVWKANRLRRDLGKLQGLNDQLAELRDGLAAAQDRAAGTGLR